MSYKTSSGTSYTLYPWSFDAGVLPANFWSPQSIVADLATSQGHLEMFASVGNSSFVTFSEAAAASALASGKDPATAALQYSDGNSTVLFDASGVGSGTDAVGDGAGHDLGLPFSILFRSRLERRLLHRRRRQEDLRPDLRADDGRPVSRGHLQPRRHRQHQRRQHHWRRDRGGLDYPAL